MKRLTDVDSTPERVVSNMTTEQLAEIYRKLSDYENTEIEPMDVKLLQDELKKEKEKYQQTINFIKDREHYIDMAIDEKIPEMYKNQNSLKSVKKLQSISIELYQIIDYMEHNYIESCT